VNLPQMLPLRGSICMGFDSRHHPFAPGLPPGREDTQRRAQRARDTSLGGTPSVAGPLWGVAHLHPPPGVAHLHPPPEQPCENPNKRRGRGWMSRLQERNPDDAGIVQVPQAKHMPEIEPPAASLSTSHQKRTISVQTRSVFSRQVFLLSICSPLRIS